MRDLADLIFHSLSLPVVARNANATVNGGAVDLSQFNRAECIVIPTSWTDGTHTFKLQDSDDNATWADVASTDLNKSSAFVPITSAGTAIVQKVGYIGIRRYLRAVVTSSGVTTGAVVGAMIVLGDFKHYGFTPNQTPTAII